MTEPQMGAQVQDSTGKMIGTIDYIVRDSWSGDVRKYIAYRKPPEEDVAFTPEEIAEVTDSLVKLTISAD